MTIKKLIKETKEFVIEEILYSIQLEMEKIAEEDVVYLEDSLKNVLDNELDEGLEELLEEKLLDDFDFKIKNRLSNDNKKFLI